ncbi:MAG: hypothetical protein BGO68_05640 [Candidatus Amoebophilus sp. 36-38]|nr:MAG: hypothetical protein BGO68_05640 [Candidatus Amoebophilus sp. 36-38]
MFSPKGYLCIFLLIANIHHSFAFEGAHFHASINHEFSLNNPSTTLTLDTFKTSLKPIPKKPKTILKRKKQNSPKKKEHPRKKLLEEEPIHTQRTWLYSTIVPGLGQVYNKDYWKLPLIYGVFGILTWAAMYNHTEYTTARREFIEKYKGNPPKDYSSLGNMVEGFKRERTIYIAAIGLWYLINIFDAYVGGTLKTFDVSDDLELIVQPTKPKDAKSSPSVGLTISLQQKDEDRLSWLR